VTKRNNVHVSGSGDSVAVLVHGFGVDQRAWDRILPALEARYQVVRYDLTGLGRSDLAAYDRERHGTLQGHAQDLLEICAGLGVRDGLLVGHSAGGMIGLLAAIAEPALFGKLVLLATSPCYLNEPGYVGGFEREQAERVITAVAADYVAWCNDIVPIAVGQQQGQGITDQVLQSFRKVDPDVASHIFRVILFSDHRAALPLVQQPALILQASRDAFVPMTVARYMQAQLPQARLQTLTGQGGHFPHLGTPQTVVSAVQAWLGP
jgi:sigma-B regulation protein RsbQ